MAFLIAYFMIPKPPSRWNSGRAVGPRTALTPDMLARLIADLTARGDLHDLALLATGVDTMLRASDLLRLKVGDVQLASGHIREQLFWRQQKTGANVAPVLTEFARTSLAAWIAKSGKRRDDYLFTRTKPGSAGPIKPGCYRRLVKAWLRRIGIDPADYSSHSIRRTKPAFMYRAGCPVADISKLLGHKTPAATLEYLGVTTERLRAQALKYDVFAARARTAVSQAKTG